MPSLDESARQGLEQLGNFIRAQRQLAELSLRELAARANVSNPYLSQVERGLHEPSVRVLQAIATALNLSAETLLVQAGLLGGADRPAPPEDVPTTEAAIEADANLNDEQRVALIAVYRSYVAQNTPAPKPTKKRAANS